MTPMQMARRIARLEAENTQLKERVSEAKTWASIMRGSIRSATKHTRGAPSSCASDDALDEIRIAADDLVQLGRALRGQTAYRRAIAAK